MAKPNGYKQAFSVLSLKNDFWYQKEGSIKRVRDVIFKTIEPRFTNRRENIFLETSAIYLTYADVLYSGHSLVGSDPFPIELSKMASIDIDSKIDLEIASKFFVEEFNEKQDNEQQAKDDFIKFLSESRDWSYTYIEDVQSTIGKFIKDIEPEIKYFDEYGVVGSAYPHYYSMKKISSAYKELKGLLPEDYGKLE